MPSARPRVEGGYVDVPRYLLDALIAAPGLTCAGLRVLLEIVRLTWGFYPDKNRAGARISCKTIAERTGLSLRTVRKVMPDLTREGIVQQLSLPSGRSAAVLRVNPEPTEWGRFVPVEYAAGGTQAGQLSTGAAVEYSARRTLRANEREDSPSGSTQSTPAGVPTVPRAEHSTGSHELPSFKLPSSELPSAQDPAAGSPEEPAPGSCQQIDTAAAIAAMTSPRLKELTGRFLKRAEEGGTP